MGRGRRALQEKAEFLREEAEYVFGETPVAEPRSIGTDHISGEIDLRAQKTLQRKGWNTADIQNLFPKIPGIRYEVKIVQLRRNLVQIQGLLRGTNNNEVLGRMKRTLDLEHKIAYHNGLEIIDPENQGQGIGLRFFMSSLEQYEKHGIQSIDMYANSQIGGYFWARVGFQLSSAEAGLVVRRSLEETLEELEEAMKILNSADSPNSQQAIDDLGVNISFLKETLGNKKIRMDLVAAFRPLVRIDKGALNSLRQEHPDIAETLAGLRGKPDDPLSGKTLLLGSGWAGSFGIGDPLSREILEEYLRSKN